MATNQKPPRRSDVVHCEHCGEDYSTTYKRCPFCDERPGRGPSSSGKRVANNTRGGGYGRAINPLQIAGLVISLVLIIAALYIVFTVIAPLFGKGGAASSSSTSTDTSQSGSASASGSASGAQSQPGSAQTPGTTINVAALALNRADITLRSGEAFTFTPTIDPADAVEQITWSSDNPAVATVSDTGTVTNVNTGTGTVAVTITAQAGERTASCVVRCNGTGASSGTTTPTPTPTPAPTTGAVAPGAVGVVTGAGGGLNVRSGPASSNPSLASLVNGNKVTVLEDAGDGWYKVSVAVGNGKTKTGYVSKQFIAPAN